MLIKIFIRLSLLYLMRSQILVVVLAICIIVPAGAGIQSVAFTQHTDIIDQVTVSMMEGYIQALQDIGPRVTGTSGTEEAARYITAHFQSLGLTVREDPWEYRDYEDVNIEAILPGVNRSSNRVFVICAHYDTVQGSPGADDDGSGTAAVMAAAQVLSQFQFQHTIKFVTFSGEEQGLLGSHEYARVANETGVNIVGVLNADMIGYTETEEGRTQIEIQETPESMWLTNVSIAFSQEYRESIDLQVVRDSAHPYSDHYSFIRYGFNATFFFEYEFNDYYHSPEDVIENMDLDYCTRVTRLMVGTLAELAELATGDWTPPYLRMDTPAPGRLYFRGQELIPLPFGTTVVVGGLTVTVYAGDNDTGMDRVEFYVDGVLQATDDQDPYQFVWDQPSLFRRTLEAQAYDRAGNRASVTSRIWTFIF